MDAPRLIAHEIAFAGSGIAAWTTGPQDAPWLVICHGGGLDHASFRPLVRSLASEWRVLLWDMPGHGQSRPMPRRFSAALCAEALAAVMDHVGAEAATLLGFSFGGVVGQIFAKRWPRRVQGLVAYACFTPHLLPPLVPGPLVKPTVQAAFGDLSWALIKADFAQRCSVRQEVRDAIAASMQPLGKGGFLRMASALLSASDPDPSFRIPGGLAVIRGEDDSNGPALEPTFAAYAAAYPGTFSTVIPNAGHCAHQDAPEAFEAALRGALASLRPA